jgi:hypothetical protein
MTSYDQVLTEFSKILVSIEEARQDDDAVESAMVTLLGFIKAHPEARPAFVSAFVESVSGTKGAALDVIAFCMHELRWPEILEAARTCNRNPNPRSMNLIARIIEAYDDDWDSRDLYAYFGGASKPGT